MSRVLDPAIVSAIASGDVDAMWLLRLYLATPGLTETVITEGDAHPWNDPVVDANASIDDDADSYAELARHQFAPLAAPTILTLQTPDIPAGAEITAATLEVDSELIQEGEYQAYACIGDDALGISVLRDNVAYGRRTDSVALTAPQIAAIASLALDCYLEGTLAGAGMNRLRIYDVRLVLTYSDPALAPVRYFAEKQHTIDGQLYEDRLIVLAGPQFSRTAIGGTCRVAIDNIDLALSQWFIDHRDDLQGSTVKLALYFFGPGLEHLVFEGQVASVEVDESSLALECSAIDLASAQLPQRSYSPLCTWKFRSVECGYSGAETSCNKTFARCTVLTQIERFNGVLTITRQLSEAVADAGGGAGGASDAEADQRQEMMLSE